MAALPYDPTLQPEPANPKEVPRTRSLEPVTARGLEFQRIEPEEVARHHGVPVPRRGWPRTT